jgi:NTE family protein
MALTGACPVSAIPRDGLLEIDHPVWVGLNGITARLESVRAFRPVVAMHLSGGSARGLAHLGVLRRLEEAGFLPDLIVTTSAGSVVGLLFAAGVPVDVIADIFLTVDFAELFTAKLPTGGGIADLRGLAALVHELVGDADLAGLPTPAVAVCEDLRSMRRVLLAEGDVSTVLQAAITIPALFDPVECGDMALVDGGLTSIAPMGPFREMADAHIASTTFYGQGLEPKDPFTAFTMAINAAKTRPAVEDIRSMQPFLIRNDVESLTYMGWHRLGEIFRRGYDACSRSLPELTRYLAQRGCALSLPPSPERLRLAAVYRTRWAAIRQRLAAGQPIRLDRAYTALQVHPLLLKLYGEPNRLEERNYAALSWLYEGPAGGVRVGALSDIESRHGAFLDVSAATRGGLAASLRSFLFASDPAGYHLFRSGWPVPLGERLAAGPLARGELLWRAEERRAIAAAGFGMRLAGVRAPDAISGELAVFFERSDLFGPEAELVVRRRFAGPLHVLARGFYRQCWQRDGEISPSYNDFFRGSGRDAAVGSYAVVNTELILRPDDFFLTFWEAVIFRKLELAAFCDVLWDEAARLSGSLHPSVGASLRGDAALGGLLPLSAMLSVGYDLDSEHLVVTLNLGTPY